MCLIKVMFVLYGIAGGPVYEVCMTHPNVQDNFILECSRQHYILTSKETNEVLVSVKPICKMI